jgi:DNA-binding NarL/FixJ family response regulator
VLIAGDAIASHKESTAKTHIKRILMKLHLRDRIHAVIFAYETGVTQPGPKPAA